MDESTESGGGNFYLDVKGGVHDRKRIRVGPKGIVVGRSPKADVVLPDSKISRQHARFYVKDGYCYVEDMGARNGVLVQGRRHKKLCLQDGDIVDLGYCKLRLTTEGSLKERTPMPELADYAADLKAMAKAERPPLPRVPLHPFVIASLVFVVLAAALYWPFAVGAVILAGLALRDIRLTGKHYGKGLAMIAIALGLFSGALSAYVQHTTGEGGGSASLQCRRNLGRIGEALSRYAREHDGYYPPSLTELSYVGPQDWLGCPNCRGAAEGCMYRFPGAGRSRDPSSDAVVACDRRLSNHGRRGGNVLRATGLVEWLPAEDFEPMLSGVGGR